MATQMEIILRAVDRASAVIEKTADQAKKSMDGAAAAADKAGGQMESVWSRVGHGLGVAVVAGAAVAVGAVLGVAAAAYKAGEAFDEAYDTIRIGTGATGQALAGLQDDFRAVVAKVPADFGAAGTAIADLNTRLGLTGPPLQALTTQVLNLARITGSQVPELVATTTRVFGDWSVATDQQSGALDYLFKTSQSTGIGISRLGQLMVQYGAPLRQMGFGFEQSAAMLGKFEKEGVNTELVLGSLRIALVQMAQQGVSDPAAALQTIIERIKEAGSAGEANAMAMEFFGSRAGPDMAAAIREGRLDLDQLIQSLKASPETINGAADATADFAEKWKVAKNQTMLALEPISNGVFALASSLVDRLMPTFNQFASWVSANMPAIQATMESVFNGVGYVISGAIAIIQGLVAAWMFLQSNADVILPAVGAAVATLTVLMLPRLAAMAAAWWAQATAAMAAGAATIIALLPIIGPVLLVGAAVAALALIWRKWGDDIIAIVEGVGAWLAGAWESIKATIVSVWEGIKAWFKDWWETLLVVIGGPLGLLILLIIKHWDDITRVTQETWNTITTFLTGLWTGIRDTALGIWTAIRDGILGIATRVADGIRSVLQPIWDWLAGLATEALEWGANLMRSFARGIASIKIPVPHITMTWSEGPLGIKIPDFDIGVSMRALGDLIPWLAKGGIATGPTIAGVGEAGAEAILPLNRLVPLLSAALQDAGGAGGQGGTVIQHLVLDARGATFQDGRDLGNRFLGVLEANGFRVLGV